MNLDSELEDKVIKVSQLHKREKLDWKNLNIALEMIYKTIKINLVFTRLCVSEVQEEAWGWEHF